MHSIRSYLHKTTKALICAVTAVVVLAAPASACMWEYVHEAGSLLWERRLTDLGASPVRNLYSGSEYTRSEWEAREVRLQAEPDYISNYKKRSDRGVALAHIGRHSEALEIFKAIEIERPDTYINAANMGTTYELLGQPETALEWIRKSVKINPQSHSGTEWVHERILEVQIKQKETGAFDGVLHLDFGAGLLPSKPTAASSGGRSAEEVREAIRYQLVERLQFVTPPNAVVADLLADYANFELIFGFEEDAKSIFNVAKQFGYIERNSQEIFTRYYLSYFRISLWIAVIVLVSIVALRLVVWCFRKVAALESKSKSVRNN